MKPRLPANSELFTYQQLLLLQARIEGVKKDPTGAYAKGVKPKVEELLRVWLPLRKVLEEALKKPEN